MYTYKIDSLQQLFDKSSDAITIMCNSIFFDCNDAAIALFRASSKEELLSLHPSVVSPEYQPNGESSLDKANRIFFIVARCGNHRFEWQHKTLDGRIFWVDINMTLIVTPDGKELQYAVLRDITVAKEHEKALEELHLILESKIESRTLELQQQSQFLASIYNGIDTPVYIYDVNEKGIYMYSCNPACESVLGLRLQEMQYKKPSEIFGDYIGGLIEERFQECAASLLPSACEECIKINGEETWWLTTINPLIDDNMKVYRFIGTSFNITERKKTESLLSLSEMHWRNLFEKCADAMAIQDSITGEFIDCNEAAVSMLGYVGKMDIVGKSPLSLLLSPEYQPDGELTEKKGQYNIAKTFEKGSHKFEWLGKKSDGSDIYMEVVITLIDYDDRECFQATWRDITDRVMVQAELQSTQAQLIQTEKMSSLGQLVAGIAHEINNPVSFIYSNIQPALAQVDELFNIIDSCNCNDDDANNDLEFLREDLPKLLNSMHVGAERIKQIVLSLRNFSRADEAPIKEVDIHEGIDSTLMILGHKLKFTSRGKKINIIKNYAKFSSIECYPSQLNQVFMNLLSNAIDAVDGVESPGIEITTSCVGQIVKVLIKDNGVGIPENLKNKIFNPFYTTKPVGKGTGMGLGISYQIIERHQGKIWCNSQLGEGTTFVIELPMCK
jgi:PAS domain S-box-containing protein